MTTVEIVFMLLMVANILTTVTGITYVLSRIEGLQRFAETQLSRRRVVKKKETK